MSHSFKKYQQTLISFSLIILIIIFCRLPQITVSGIHWDESVYINMGNHLLDGNLPYIELWEMKPPVLFMFYMICLALFGKTIIAVRVGGIIILSLSAYLIFRTHKHLLGGKYLPFLTVFYFTIFSCNPILDGVAVMAEHVALLPLSFAIYLILQRNLMEKGMPIFHLGLIGFLLSIASLIRYELAYFATAVMFLLLSLLFNKRSDKKLFLALIIGFCIPYITTLLIYSISGNIRILYITLIKVPFSYSRTGFPVGKKIIEMICKDIKSSNFLIWTMVFVFPLVIMHKYSKSPYVAKKILLFRLTFLLVVMMFTLLQLGQLYGHYMLSLAPIAALIAGLSTHLLLQTRLRVFVVLLIVIGTCLSLTPFYKQYKSHYSYYLKNNTFDTGLDVKVANHIKQYKVKGEYVFFSTSTLGYMLTGSISPTKYIDPSTILFSDIIKTIEGDDATFIKELEKIFANKPVFVVLPGSIPSSQDHSDPRIIELEKFIMNELNQNYIFNKKIENIYIFKRKITENVS